MPAIRLLFLSVLSLCASTLFAQSAARPLRIGLGHAPPMISIGPQGQPGGFSVEAITEAARRAGISVQWVPGGTPAENDQLLRDNKLDIVLGTATAERKQHFFLSDPWWTAELVAVTANKRLNLRVQGDLDGRRLAVAPGAIFVVSQALPKAALVPVSNALAAAVATCKGEVDGAVFAAVFLRELLAGAPQACQGVGLRMIDLTARIDYVLVARPETAPAVRALKDRLDEITADGTLATIAARHPPTSTPQATRLSELLRIRYERFAWRASLAAFGVVILFAGIFLVRLNRARQRLSEANQRMASDLEARLRAENAWKESEARFRSLLDAAPQTVLTTTQEGTIAYANARAESMFGYASGELIGRNVASLFPARIRELGETVPPAGTPDLAGLRKDGTEFRLELAGGRFEPGDRFSILFLADISDRIALEQHLRQSQKLESVGLLAGGVAHDFNNLLTVIGGYAQLLLSQVAPGTRLRAPIEEIANASTRAATLTRQLLTFSRRQITSPRTIALNDLLSNLERMLRRVIREDIVLELKLHASHPWIYADPGLLEQVVMNLVVNSRDALPDGGRITIETRNPSGEDLVVLRVEDTGIGMTPEVKERIFEPFFTTKETGKGTGLGLAVVYGIVQQTGAAIQVESEVNAGTIFEISFPRREPEPSRTQPAPTEVAAVPIREATILVVEDEPGVRDFVCDTLRLHGYHVLKAGNGREALELMQNGAGTVDLLLTDAIMPEMGGAALARHFLEHYPATAILQMSGYADRETQIDARLPLLVKPFTAASLLALIRELIVARSVVRPESPRT